LKGKAEPERVEEETNDRCGSREGKVDPKTEKTTGEENLGGNEE
jgi:hypothetical protein